MHRRHILFSAWLSFTLVSCADPLSPAARPDAAAHMHLTPYVVATAVDLGTLGGTHSTARDINATGTVVGVSDMPDGHPHAFVWQDGVGMLDLTPDILVTVQSAANGVNASGQIVGWMELPPYAERLPVSWDNGTLHVLGGTDPVLNPRGEARGINDAGVVTGNVELSGCRWPTFATSCERLIGPPHFEFSPHVGNAINAIGHIAGRGFSLAASMLWRDFDDHVIPAGDFSVFNGAAHDLNSSSTLVGWATLPPPDLTDRAFLWTEAGGTVDLGTLGGSESIAHGINDQDIVVGWAHDAVGRRRAFVWRADIGMHDLGTLGGPNATAIAINEANQVVGTSDVGPGVSHATLWTFAIVTVIDDLAMLGDELSEAASKVALSAGVEHALRQKLDGAREHLGQSRIAPARGLLGAFINQLEGLRQASLFPAAEADPLLARAHGILARLE
jgi:probable HAF family extracellular repeat protein